MTEEEVRQRVQSYNESVSALSSAVGANASNEPMSQQLEASGGSLIDTLEEYWGTENGAEVIEQLRTLLQEFTQAVQDMEAAVASAQACELQVSFPTEKKGPYYTYPGGVD